MPTLHLRAVPSELLTRLRAGARQRDQALDVYALETLAHGLDARDARARGARIGNASLTPQERSERARKAVLARIAKHQSE